MSILNVNQIQPVGGGNTITVSASDVSAPGVTITASSFVGTATIAQGLIGTPDITVRNIQSGIVTATTFSGNVTGGSATFAGDVSIADKIVHTSDTNTALRFPAADTFTVETAGSERLRVDSSGRMLLRGAVAGSNGTADDLVVANNASASDQAGITIRGGTSGRSQIFFSDGTSGESEYIGMLRYDHSENSMQFRTAATERLRILSDGTVATGGLSATPGTVAAGSYVQAAANAGFFNNGYDGKFGTSSNHPVYFQVNGSSKASITSAGNLTINDGNLVVASGHGIDFSATGDGGGMASELLDDYEEGTYNPSISFQSSGSATLNTSFNTLSYIKIGRLVTISGQLRIASVSSPSGNMAVSLPFTVISPTELGRSGGALFWLDISAGSGNYYKNIPYIVTEGTTTLRIENVHFAGGVQFAASDEISFAVTYASV
jgi:hypothetical protein